MVIIIDYGMGNLKSVYNAVKQIGVECRISGEIKDIENAEKLILPGVGSFKDAIDNISKAGLINVIKSKVEDGCPLLGICLGMQLLFDEGYEGDKRSGFGFIKGKIKLIKPYEKVKIPHIGWNKLEINKKDNIINGISTESFVYYVHSFMATEVDNENLIAYSEYGGIKIPGLVNKKNVYGAQFHPEKSGENGLKILQNFLEVKA